MNFLSGTNFYMNEIILENNFVISKFEKKIG